jgi:protein-disulfide isomerase
VTPWSGSVGFGALPVPAFTFAGGSLIFLGFLAAFFFALVFGYYTRKGSGISQRPYRRPDAPSESPSQLAHDITQEVRKWERGTGGHRGRPRDGVPRVVVDEEIADALREWRQQSKPVPHLDPPVSASDHVHGDGPGVTVTIYVDLAAEPCRSAWLLLTRVAQQRPIRVVVRHLPLADVHKLALPAAETLEAAGAQGQFFALLDQLARTGLGDDTQLLDSAGRLVADPERLELELSEGRHRATVAGHIRQATASGARAIPELYINESVYDGRLDFDSLTRALS